MATPTKQQFEVRVLEIVDQVLGNRRPEDDFVECKSQWTDGAKAARQLAGAANCAAPDPIIWLVGVDEKARTVTNPDPVEVSNWIAQLEKQFDGVAPQLVRDVNVVVPGHGQVTALLFETDRAPYVVRTTQNNPVEYEVPMRAGTRTRTARRAELLRMLAPSADVPTGLVLEAELYAEVEDKVSSGAPTRKANLRGSIVVFIEHLTDRICMMPNHEMSAVIRCDAFEQQVRIIASTSSFPVFIRHDAPPPPAPPPRPGVTATNDGLLVTAPGSGALTIREFSLENPDDYFRICECDTWELSIRLGVIGATRPLYLTTTLPRTHGPTLDDDWTTEATDRRASRTTWSMNYVPD